MERLSESEITEALKGIPGWEVKEGALSRFYKFKDFQEGMAFVNRVAQLAEAADHHPDIWISYSKVRLTLVTHSAGGLTSKDFSLAQQIG